MEYPIRINKYLAQKGLSTRRGADALIEEGSVYINGKPATLGQKVQRGDAVEVRNLTTKDFEYLLYYKPRGVITHSPGKGESDIVSEIRDAYGITGVFPIGRLDKDSEGLMLLTNDGRVTGRLLSPEHGHEREYLVSVDKLVTSSFLKKLQSGVNIEGYVTKPARALKNASSDRTFNIILTEGKKHQVRRMCAALGYQVVALKRVRILEFALGKLKPGQYRKLKERERSLFLKHIGLS